MTNGRTCRVMLPTALVWIAERHPDQIMHARHDARFYGYHSPGDGLRGIIICGHGVHGPLLASGADSLAERRLRRFASRLNGKPVPIVGAPIMSEHLRISLHHEPYNSQWYSIVLLEGEERHRSTYYDQPIQAMTDAVLASARFLKNPDTAAGSPTAELAGLQAPSATAAAR
jgi:hypothetical protein